MKLYSSVDEHPFLSKYKNDDHDVNKNIGDGDYTDKVLIIFNFMLLKKYFLYL